MSEAALDTGIAVRRGAEKALRASGQPEGCVEGKVFRE